MNKIILSQDLRNSRLKEDPTCSKCGITKTVADFPRKAVDYWCNTCRRDYARKAYRQKVAKMSPVELAMHRAAVNERQNKRRRNYITTLPNDDREAFFQRVRASSKQSRDLVRDETYRAYGGYRCNCCGETERAFLSIDHVNNDGAEHRRQAGISTGEQLHRWLKRNGFPEGFQILCMNCQWGKRNNKGVCPHQVRCNDYPERE